MLRAVEDVICNTVNGFHKWPVPDYNEWDYVQKTLSRPALQLFMLLNKLGWTHFIEGTEYSFSIRGLRRMMSFYGIPPHKHLSTLQEVSALVDVITWDLHIEGVAEL